MDADAFINSSAGFRIRQGLIFEKFTNFLTIASKISVSLKQE
jgi:hypothetical protein